MKKTRLDARYAILDYMSVSTLRKISNLPRHVSPTRMIENIIENWDNCIEDIEDEWLKIVNTTWRVATGHKAVITLEYDPNDP